MKRAMVVLLSVLIASCAPFNFVKEGLTQAEFNRDIYQCKLDARRSGPYGNSMVGFREIVSECMIAQGYTLQK